MLREDWIMKRILATCVTSALLGLMAMPAYAGRGDRDDDRGRAHDTRNDRSDRGRDRDNHDRGGTRIDVDISLGRDRFERPRYETRNERIWIEPTYRTVCDRVWVEAEYQTICDRIWHEAEYATTCEKVWVDPVYEWRDIVRVDGRGGRFVVREQVMVCAGHYEDRQQQVLIREGWWETVERRVCIREGYWRTIERRELVCPGHWEMRETRVDCGDRGDRYR
jgi:hypothetical protein